MDRRFTRLATGFSISDFSQDGTNECGASAKLGRERPTRAVERSGPSKKNARGEAWDRLAYGSGWRDGLFHRGNCRGNRRGDKHRKDWRARRYLTRNRIYPDCLRAVAKLDLHCPVTLLRLSVTCVRPVHTLWKKTLAAALAPPRQGGAPGFTTHARAKSMLLFAGAFGWLESAFHNGEPAKGEGTAMLGSWRALSMEAHKAVQASNLRRVESQL